MRRLMLGISLLLLGVLASLACYTFGGRFPEEDLARAVCYGFSVLSVTIGGLLAFFSQGLVRVPDGYGIVVSSWDGKPRVIRAPSAWVEPWTSVLGKVWLGGRVREAKINNVLTTQLLPVDLVVTVMYDVDVDKIMRMDPLPRSRLLRRDEMGWENTLRDILDYVARSVVNEHQSSEALRLCDRAPLEQEMERALRERAASANITIKGLWLRAVNPPPAWQQAAIEREKARHEAEAMRVLNQTLFDLMQGDNGELTRELPRLLLVEQLFRTGRLPNNLVLDMSSQTERGTTVGANTGERSDGLSRRTGSK